jgi:two-component system OmpR family sensor kinase
VQYRTLRLLLATISGLCTFISAMILVLFIFMTSHISLWLILLTVPFAVFAFCVAYAIAGVYLGPLNVLVTKTKQLAGGELQVKFADEKIVASPLGVRELATSLDKVTARVRSSMAEVSAEGKRQGQFISDVSHEIRTPLTSIRGAAETIMDADIPLEDRQRFCRTIVFESERLTRLANDLLTLQRIEGDGEIVLARVNLHGIVERAANMLEPLLESRQALFTFGGEAPDVLGDPDRLQQVVQNLIENASRFVPSGGRVHVELSGIREHSVITVSDNGPGFGDIDPARLFDRFYRGDFSRARTTGGTGLGLTIVKAIVTAHEGTVEAVNLPGGGACFIVAIPSLPPQGS